MKRSAMPDTGMLGAYFDAFRRLMSLFIFSPATRRRFSYQLYIWLLALLFLSIAEGEASCY